MIIEIWFEITFIYFLFGNKNNSLTFLWKKICLLNSHINNNMTYWKKWEFVFMPWSNLTYFIATTTPTKCHQISAALTDNWQQNFGQRNQHMQKKTIKVWMNFNIYPQFWIHDYFSKLNIDITTIINWVISTNENVLKQKNKLTFVTT